MESSQLGGDQIGVVSNITESGPGRYGELGWVVQPRIEERAFPVYFQIRDEGIPMCHRTPAGPRVQIHTRQTECRRNQRGGGFSVIAKSLSIEKHFGVEFAG